MASATMAAATATAVVWVPYVRGVREKCRVLQKVLKEHEQMLEAIPRLEAGWRSQKAYSNKCGTPETYLACLHPR